MVQDALPTELLYVPALHATQAEELVALTVALCVPALHAMHKAEAAADQVPAAHSVQALPLQKVPAAQVDCCAVATAAASARRARRGDMAAGGLP